MATAINISSQFNAFVDFANKAIAGTVGTRGEDTVARIGAKGLGGRTITFATDDKVASMWRWQSSKDANDSVRDLFQRAVIEVFGGEDKIPDSVLDAMKVTIRKTDLEKLAQADWSKYDRDGISAAYKQSGGKNLDVIPEEYRFKVNAKVSFRFNLEA